MKIITILLPAAAALLGFSYNAYADQLDPVTTPGQERYHAAIKADADAQNPFQTPTQPATPYSAAKPADAQTPEEKQVSDDDIQSAIEKGLKSDKTLSDNAKNLSVVVSFGNVTLWGTVNGADEKAKVEKIASNIKGVKKVINRVDTISK